VQLPGNAEWIRTAAASILVCAAGGVLLFRGTDGFQAFTTEQARRISIEQSPRLIPVVQLEDQDGRAFAMSDYEGHAVAVNFIYTQCTTVCALLSTGFQRLHHESDDGDPVPLLSISFDPRDTPARLREYAAHFGADGRAWRFARARDTTAIAPMLRTFGVVVIPDGKGDFQHNAAIHVVNAAGRLARILDPDASPDAVVHALSRP